MNVPFQDIINEYKTRFSELTYTNVCQQLALKQMDDKVRDLEEKLNNTQTLLQATEARVVELETKLAE